MKGNHVTCIFSYVSPIKPFRLAPSIHWYVHACRCPSKLAILPLPINVRLTVSRLAWLIFNNTTPTPPPLPTSPHTPTHKRTTHNTRTYTTGGEGGTGTGRVRGGGINRNKISKHNGDNTTAHTINEDIKIDTNTQRCRNNHTDESKKDNKEHNERARNDKQTRQNESD